MKENKFSSEDLQNYEGHYNEDAYWDKLKKIARKVGVKMVYYSLVLYEILTDKNTPAKYRAVIAGALGYFILPTDLIPDFLPAVGFADDWAALLAAVVFVAKAVTPEIKARAKARLEKWFGPVADTELGDLK
ncbi:MAG: DUF1232 domain-containing protein [Bacteroidales bacterium]|nr:DUF1232 domain-containing protein [Bacteroidales bacterium]